jgi:hypothetical protein
MKVGDLVRTGLTAHTTRSLITQELLDTGGQMSWR